jgi:hypothetical protein
VRNAQRILARKPEGKRPLGIKRRNWEVNIKIGKPIEEIGYESMNWIYLSQNRD